jgi:hypothetical protein
LFALQDGYTAAETKAREPPQLETLQVTSKTVSFGLIPVWYSFEVAVITDEVFLLSKFQQMTDARCKICGEREVGVKDIIHVGYGDRYQVHYAIHIKLT